MLITTLYAALLTLVYVTLAAFVMHARWKFRVGLGDGNNPVLTQRIRMHGNFAEYAPFGVLLLFLVEFSGIAPLAVHVLGIMLLAGRILHAWGLHSSAYVSVGRSVGMIMTLLMFLIAAGLLLSKISALAFLAFS